MRTDISESLLLGGVTGRDHFFSVSGGGAAPIALCGGFSVNVSEELTWLESGDNEVD